MNRKSTEWDEKMRLQCQLDGSIRSTDGVRLDEHKVTSSGEKWILTHQGELPDVDGFEESLHINSIERRVRESGLVVVEVQYA